MPLGGFLSLAPALISTGGALAGLFGGGSSPTVQPAPGYNFKYKKQADKSAYEGIGDLAQYNTAAQVLPQYMDLTQQGVNNPYAAGYQSAVGPIGQMGQAGGQSVYDTGLSLLPNVEALMALGFDPQQALYARTANQVQQQARAGLASRGLLMDPYGAGVENQAMSDFNIDWQNNLLQRALAAAQGAGSLYGQAGQGINTGLGTMTAGAALPYNTAQGINANQLGLLSGAGAMGQQAAAIPQTQIQDYLNYLSGARGQQQANNQGQQLALQAQQQQFAQNQALGSNLGAGLAGIKSGWGSQNPFAAMSQPVSNPYGGVANPTYF